MLSSDRIGPRVFDAAGAKFDTIPSKDRPNTLATAARLFTYLFLGRIGNDLLVYCPTKNSPLRIDRWLLTSEQQFPSRLPTTVAQATNIDDELDKHFPFLCVANWTVTYPSDSSALHTKMQSESDCLAKIQGWSLCFDDNKLPDDFGGLLESMAIEMAQQAGTLKRIQQKRGPKEKLGPLVDSIVRLYPNGLAGTNAKDVERRLKANGETDFGETTLNKAVRGAKDHFEQAVRP